MSDAPCKRRKSTDMAAAELSPRERYEAKMLERVWKVSLTSTTDAGEKPESGAIVLEGFREELIDEGEACILSRKSLDRAVMARLTSEAIVKDLSSRRDAEASPIQYLMNTFRRALDEESPLGRLKDKEFATELTGVLATVRDLAVSYAGSALLHQLFPQPREALQRGEISQFQDILANDNIPGFLQMFCQRYADDGLSDLVQPVVLEISRQVSSVSILGDFLNPLNRLTRLCSVPELAREVVRHPQWSPINAANGRLYGASSVLGPFLSLSWLPDVWAFKQAPDVAENCFSKAKRNNQREFQSNVISLRNTYDIVVRGIYDCVRLLMKDHSNRELVLQFFATALEKNRDRGKTFSNELLVASDGFACTLASVLLKFCEPFLEDGFSKMNRIDVNYVFKNKRMDLSEDTKIAATSEEVEAWVDKRNLDRAQQFAQLRKQQEEEELKKGTASSRISSSPAKAQESSDPSEIKYHFICECFFITARVLHISLVKLINTMEQNARDFHRMTLELTRLERIGEADLNANDRQRLVALRDRTDKSEEHRFSTQSFLVSQSVIKPAIQYYRLMATWLHTVALQGNPKDTYPLPVPVPMEWACLPEDFADDLADVMLFVGRMKKHGVPELRNESMEKFMDFLVVFSGSPLYIKNPYLRAKLVEVLNLWMPSSSNRFANDGQLLFEAHPMTVKYLVANLIGLYVDVEYTGSHTQFYDKFNIRHHIAELLEYLWGIPAHRAKWVEFSQVEERGKYLKFMNLVANDLIYLLDEGLNKLREIKEIEVLKKNMSEWERLSDEEKEEKESMLSQAERIAGNDFTLASDYINMLEYSTSTVRQSLFLPEMLGRMCGMLNYFLEQLAGPKRKMLKTDNIEKFGFRPRELLGKIVTIYINLEQEKRPEFIDAIVKDSRSFRVELFDATYSLISSTSGAPIVSVEATAKFEKLVEEIKMVAESAMEAEEALGDIPEEFTDPIECELMRDPVLLPSSKTICDRKTIQRHLLSDSTDPFNRSHLTVDMLIPQTDLKEKIEAWLRSKR